jgi:V/A-type H+-transporting ATPase subunit I
MIVSMDRIEIVMLKSELPRMVPFLQEQGVVHVEDVPLALENHPGYLHRVHLAAEQKAELEALEDLARQLSEAEPLLLSPPSPTAVAGAGPKHADAGVESLSDLVRPWHRTLRSLARRRLNIEDNLAVIRRYWETLEAISPTLAVRNIVLGENARLLVLEDFGDAELAALAARVRRDIGQECELYWEFLGKGRHIAVLTHPAGRRGQADALLQSEAILPLEAPDRAVQGDSIAEVLRKIQARIAGLEADLAAIHADLAAFSEESGPALVAVRQVVETRLSGLAVVDHFAQSRMIAVVHGWVPSDRYEPLQGALAKNFGDQVAMDRLRRDDVEVSRVPTLLKNHPLLKPFQLILKMFNPPTYGSLDPTTMVAVAFIMFYGFILGDAGYGLFIIGVATWARNKFSHNEFVCDAMSIARWMGASSIVWGIVYLEFFGNMPERLLGLHPPLHRGHEPILMLSLAVAYGLVHVPLGLILGIREGYRHHDHHHAEEKLGMLLGLFALIVAVVAVVGYFPLGATAGYASAGLLFMAGLFYMIKSMGGMFAVGVLEILGLSSNILSYARLMALGMASVVLADLANELIYNSSGIMLLLIGIPMAGLIHLLNIGIGVFSPTIHSLRLNYVEFLPKFYEPEGRNYTPFRKGVAW